MSNVISCAVILAGGQGKRMKSELPKPMFEVLGEPMLKWVMSACEKAGVDDMCVVTGYNSEVIENYLDGRCETVFQLQRKGTGHAVMMTEEWLKKHIGSNVIVLCGDAPFVDENTIKAALEQHTSQGNAVTVITAEIDNPTGYGRIIRTENGISAIVEEKDASAEQKAIREINSGAYWFDTEKLLEALEKLEPNNAQGEYYLTDTVEILIGAGYRADAYISPNPNVVMGANDRKGLLKLNDTARMAVIEKLMDDGVEFVCTDGVSIGRDVVVGAGTRILQGTILRGSTVIGCDCVIGPNTVVENCTVGDKTILNSVQAYESRIDDSVKIGPFVHIRPNSHIKSGVKIGDFVEVKNSTIGERKKKGVISVAGKIIAQNKKAYHEYFVEEKYEAGIALFGTEVKSIRAGAVNLKDAYCSFKNGELYVLGMHISPYEKGNIFNREPLRERKLLMHRRELNKLFGTVAQKGLTLVPLSLYFCGKNVKVEVGLCRGKKLYDKRDVAAKTQASREMDRRLKEQSHYD